MNDELNTTFLFSTHDTRIIGAVEIIYTLEDGQLLGSDRKKGGRPNEESLQNRCAQPAAV